PAPPATSPVHGSQTSEPSSPTKSRSTDHKKPKSPQRGASDEKPELAAPVDVYIPSAKRLVEAARHSRTAKILEAGDGVFSQGPREQADGLDAAAFMPLLDQISSWTDTSVSLSVYTQDPDGRPRWAVRVDWPIDELRKRVQALLKDEAAAKILGKI